MNETLLTWIIFIITFGGVVIIHEIGHFVAARLVKIEVAEFGIGFPTPGAITMFTWQGTRFTFNWLHIGGFVRPKGENDPDTWKVASPPPPRGRGCSYSRPVPS